MPTKITEKDLRIAVETFIMSLRGFDRVGIETGIWGIERVISKSKEFGPEVEQVLISSLEDYNGKVNLYKTFEKNQPPMLAMLKIEMDIGDSRLKFNYKKSMRDNKSIDMSTFSIAVINVWIEHDLARSEKARRSKING